MMNNLQQGITAFKNGNRDEARKYFIAAIKENQNDESAWGWMYQTANNDKERFECLNRILKINPGNAKAREALDKLSAPPQPIQSVPKKNNNLLIIGGIVGIILVICCICIAVTYGSPLGIQVKYVVTGSARSAFITYFNEQGGMEQVNVNLPFTKSLSVSPGAALSLVAQNSGAGTITCEIWVNGAKKKISTTTAEYGVVTCTEFAY